MADISLSSQTTKSLPFRDDARPSNRFLDEALEDNKREGLALAVKARTLSLAIIAVFLVYLNPDISVLYYEILIAAFMLNGWAQLKVGKVGKSRVELALLFLDLALMTAVLILPNPLSDDVWSPALQYKHGSFAYFYVLLAGATLAYSWRTIFAVAVWTSVLWMGMYLWANSQPNSFPEITASIVEMFTGHPEILAFADPNNIVLEARIQEVLVFLIVAGILALNSWRSKILLIRQSDLARQRANLARHFAPNIVDHLAGRDQPLGDVRSQPVVVMFVDIVGFTKMAEQISPEEVVRNLREFHGLMENDVFDYHGTLDKFLGDGLMVTFGTPDSSPDDAKNAIECSLAMQRSMDAWNKRRAASGEQKIQISVGLHYGDVILGDIGSERRLEYAVLGDVVNVSSRLEAMSRPLGASIVMSADVVGAAGGDAVVLQAGFEALGDQKIRGRDEPVNVWALRL